MKRLFLLASIFLLSSSQLVFAEITRPYTLDEKSQVLFGDSTEVDGKNGLENYVTNYVNNYLHITFTYTHAQCCFASNPPKLYITSVDPQATSTDVARDQPDVYALFQGGHPTDWYSYDVQFDSTGFNVTVLQGGATSTNSSHYTVSGLTDSDYAALVNTYAKQDPLTQYSMAFAPLPIYEAPAPPPTPVATTTPVIIVPGISGSSLIKDNNYNLEVWPSLSQMLLSINDSYLDDLALLPSGGQGSININPQNIVRETGPNDFFNGLFSNLVSNGYTENQDSFEFPYDWRLDITTSAQKLKEKIDAVKLERGVSEVNIVAHSMGGLLVKEYLRNYGGNSISKFIDIGTPHTGSPKAFKILSYGDNFGGSILFGLLGLNSDRIKSISQNMPSVYQLLPSRSYFNDYPYYVFNGENASQRLTFEETSSYLKASGRNSTLVDRADAFHQEIDGLNPQDLGVETYNIVGCGTPTIGQFYLFDSDTSHPIYNIHLINGDGTVPLKSAKAMLATSTYYVRGIPHALLPSASGVKELVASILTATSTFSFDTSPYSTLSTSESGCTIPNGKLVSFHSPIDLHIYDSLGNHTGPDTNGNLENNITGVTYEVIDENKFAFLPDGLDYTVRGEATNAGDFDLRIQEIVSGEVATTSLFNNLPLNQNSEAFFSIGSTTPTRISVDSLSYNNLSLSTGLLESTGQVQEVVEITHTTSNTGTIRNTTTEEVRVQIISTTTVATSSSKVVVTKPANNSKPVAPVIQATTTNQRYENTAAVSNSIGSKLKNPLKKLWSWFKNRL